MHFALLALLAFALHSPIFLKLPKLSLPLAWDTTDKHGHPDRDRTLEDIHNTYTNYLIYYVPLHIATKKGMYPDDGYTPL